MKVHEFVAMLMRLPEGSTLDFEESYVKLPELPCGCRPALWGDTIGEAAEHAILCLQPCANGCEDEATGCENCGHKCGRRA